MSRDVVKCVGTFAYFIVEEHAQGGNRKTRDYEIVSNSNATLGTIQFYSAWRQHVLVPSSGSIWSAGCLRDIVCFMEQLKSGEVQPGDSDG